MSAIRVREIVWVWVGLFGVACAEPAALRVEVEVHEPGLEALRVAVLRDPDKARVEELACTFPAGQKADRDCELSDGTGRWEGGLEKLVFWLYGEPKTELFVSAAGLRDADSVMVTTSTETRARLPDDPGEEAVLSLSLFARTRIHEQCSAEIPVMGGNFDRSALTLADVVGDSEERTEIIAASGSSLGIFGFVRAGDDCAVVAPPNYLDNFPSCVSLDNSLIAGKKDDSGTRILAAVCNAGNPLIGAATISGAGTPLFETLSSTVSRPVLSRPVLADLDGDHVKEIYLYTAARRALELVRWEPGENRFSRLPLTNLTPFTPNNPALFDGPLVVHDPRNQRDVLIIAGYPGGIGVVTGGASLRYQWVQPEPNPPSMAASAVVLSDERELVVQVAAMYGGRELRVTVLEGLDQVWNVRENYSLLADNDLETRVERDVRPAIGDIDGSGQLVAVTVQAGVAFVFPLVREAKVRTMPAWSGSGISGVQSVLLANIDGAPGAEIVAFDSTSNLIHAINSAGQPLDGWPLEAPAGGALRVAVGDLDAPGEGERDLEVVTLSQQRIQVFSLGPGSYDAEDTWWPLIYADSAARATTKAR